MPAFYYAVAQGHKPGIYNSWDECKAQVHAFSGAVYKKFKTHAEATCYIKERGGTSSTVVSSVPERQISTAVNKAKLSPLTSFSTVTLSKKKQSVLVTSTAGLSLGTLKRSSRTNSTDDSPVKQPRKKRKAILLEHNLANNVDVKDSKFNVDADGFVNVFTDGACKANGRRSAVAGIGVWFGDNHPLNVSRPVVGRATNNMAEIQAVTVAALQAKKAGVEKLKINTDSQFLINCITKWMPAWKRRNWMTIQNKPVINKTELIEMEKALSSLKVRWEHVRGHVGIHGNEMADMLANKGCNEKKNCF